MDPQIRDVMNQTIDVHKYVSKDGRGNLKYSTTKISLPCYIAGETRMMQNLYGQDVVSSLQVYIPGTDAKLAELDEPAKSYLHRITLPDGRTPPIIAIQPYYDEKGNVYYVLVSL